MIGFNEAQLSAWLTPVLWPLLRVLGIFTTAPVFSSRAFPVRARVGLAVLIAIAAQPSLQGQPAIALDDPLAFGTVLQQVAIGLAIGMVVRIVFAAVELAGELIGLQMGLNFAAFFDPVSNAQSSAVARFFGNIAALMFVAVNGHLMVLMAVARSFDAFPIGGSALDALARVRPHELGTVLFESALWLALPMIGLLLFVNLAMGVISRVAPQMNIYAIGFPITLTAGLLALVLVLPSMEHPLLRISEQALQLFTGTR